MLAGPLSYFEADFAAKLQTVEQSSKAALFMYNMNHNGDASIIRQLFKDLDEVKQNHSDAWGSEAEIELLGAQLNIYAYQIQHMSSKLQGITNNTENTLSKKNLILLGFRSAVRLVHIFSTMAKSGFTLPEMIIPGSSPIAIPPASIRYLPKHYYVTLLFATSFIFKAMAINKEETCSLHETARNHIRLVHQMLLSWSAHPSDEFSRAARVVEVLSRAPNLSRLNDFQTGTGATMDILSETLEAARDMRVEERRTETTNANDPSVQYATPCSPVGNSPRKIISEPVEPDLSDDINLDFTWDVNWESCVSMSDHFGINLNTELGNEAFNGLSR